MQKVEGIKDYPPLFLQLFFVKNSYRKLKIILKELEI